MADDNRRRSSISQRRASVVESFRHGSIAEAMKTGGGALEAVVLPTKDKPTFDTDSEFEKYYRPIESYEGYHRYDPAFQWSQEEETKVRRRIDWRICTWACLMFFSLQLDRGNIVQALSDNMLKDLKLNTNHYNYGQTIFYVSFLSAEVPSQLISKKLGPDRWIPIQMVCWSIVASLQSQLSGKSSFYVTRALLGLLEGGFIPDTILYLSYWYKSTELPIRLSFFWVAYQSTQIVSAFLAYGILHLRGYHHLAGWRWLFALEGLITGAIGIATAFYLPPSPTQTASRFRGKKGWFTEHEEKIMVNRILRDDPSKGDMHNRQGLSFGNFWDCLTDWHMWPIYLLGVTWLVPNAPETAYITLNLKALGFTTFHTNLLTIPAYTLFICQLLFWTWFSEKFNTRFTIGIVSELYTLTFLIALETLPKTASHWTWYGLTICVVGHPYAHAILVAITSRNAGTVRTRTVASAFYNMCVQAGSVIGQNIYRDKDKPYYRRGNKILIGIAAYNAVLFASTKLFYIFINRRRQNVWDNMSQQEREHYLATTKDKGNKRLDFRFAH